jgi:hypothetical protein
MIYEIRFQRYQMIKKHMLFMNLVSFFFFFQDFTASENREEICRRALEVYQWKRKWEKHEQRYVEDEH